MKDNKNMKKTTTKPGRKRSKNGIAKTLMKPSNKQRRESGRERKKGGTKKKKKQK